MMRPKRTFSDMSALLKINTERYWLSMKAGRNVIPQYAIGGFLNPTTPLTRHFTERKFLGQGAFGSVSLWTQNGTGKKFAIKDLGFDRQRIPHDFHIGLKLNHPNIVKIHNAVTKIDPLTNAPHTYLIMEYVDGSTLSVWNGSMQAQDNLVRQVVDSAKHMLARNITPIDFHSENLMVAKNGQFKWIDLGLYREGIGLWDLTNSAFARDLLANA